MFFIVNQTDVKSLIVVKLDVPTALLIDTKNAQRERLVGAVNIGLDGHNVPFVSNKRGLIEFGSIDVDGGSIILEDFHG